MPTGVVHGRGLLLPPDVDAHIKGVNARAPHLRLSTSQVGSPAAFSWQSIMSPIKDQGSYGNCWCFACVGVLEANWIRINNAVINASEQQIINCNRDGYGCN